MKTLVHHCHSGSRHCDGTAGNPEFRWLMLYLCFFGCGLVAPVVYASCAFAENILVDPALCSSVIHHMPDANVAYRPGYDLHGHAVPVADLPGQPTFEFPVRVKVPLTLGLVKSLDLKHYPFDKFGKGTEIYLGVLEIEGTNVMLDGVPLTDPQQEKLSVLCLQAR